MTSSATPATRDTATLHSVGSSYTPVFHSWSSHVAKTKIRRPDRPVARRVYSKCSDTDDFANPRRTQRRSFLISKPFVVLESSPTTRDENRFVLTMAAHEDVGRRYRFRFARSSE